MTSKFIIVGLTVIVYLAGMLMIGFYCSKRNDSTSQFFLGGRKMGPFVTAMSAEASDMSSYLLMGLPGLAFLCGTAEAGSLQPSVCAVILMLWMPLLFHNSCPSAITTTVIC